MVRMMLSRRLVARGKKQETEPRLNAMSPGSRPPGSTRASSAKRRPLTSSTAPPTIRTRPSCPRSPTTGALFVPGHALVEAGDEAEDVHENQRRDEDDGQRPRDRQNCPECIHHRFSPALPRNTSLT